MSLGKRIANARIEKGLTQDELAKRLGYKSRSSINKIELGCQDVPMSKVKAFAWALDVTPEYLMGWSADYSPAVTDDTVSLEVIGDVAAGYNRIANEEWTGERVEIPREWLRGKKQSDYFALRVSGDSMYPLYMNGDIVVVLRQSTMNRSGEIGVVVYDDDKATLKKIEYVMGEDWMKLIPINPTYMPETITGENLEHCRVLGVPTMLIRDLEQNG